MCCDEENHLLLFFSCSAFFKGYNRLCSLSRKILLPTLSTAPDTLFSFSFFHSWFSFRVFGYVKLNETKRLNFGRKKTKWCNWWKFWKRIRTSEKFVHLIQWRRWLPHSENLWTRASVFFTARIEYFVRWLPSQTAHFQIDFPHRFNENSSAIFPHKTIFLIKIFLYSLSS